MRLIFFYFLKKMRLMLMYRKKNLSLPYFVKERVESLPSKLPGKRGKSQLDIFKYQVFPTQNCS